jgi:hypothetical protein
MRISSFSRIAFAVAMSLTTSFVINAQKSSVWTEISDFALRQRTNERLIVPFAYRTFNLKTNAMRSILASAPEEFTDTANFTQTIISLPMPDGSSAKFRVEHSLVIERGLVEKFPELGQTYRARGVDDPTATARLDFLPGGFHAMVLSTAGTVMIDPYAQDDTENYISYFKRDAPRKSDFSCEFDELNAIKELFSVKENTNYDLIPDSASPEVSSGTQLRTYRLALAATNEYAVAVGSNTVAGTLAAEVLIMNRVNGVYERDAAIHMNIVGNNNLIAYAGDNMSCGGGSCTAANDPYANTNGSTMLGQNQTTLDSVIGSANYDIGHVFSTGGGGVAFLGVSCGSSKAGGVTGLGNPVGDAFAIDYVAHEMGHQWGANHTFNGTVSSCGGGNRSSGSAYEPGSGITIMAYAGICGNQNLAAHSIDTFHVKSLESIVSFSQNGSGNACAVTTSSGNTPPSVAVVGGPAFNVPKQTPFTLTASANDVNGDAITYDWQEYDLGASTTAVPNTDADGARPIFRPYLPTTSPIRTYPSLQFILNNANVPPSITSGFLTGELLPAITRTMTFQVIARDNQANAGGISTATATVNVDGNSGPFNITAPNTAITVIGGTTTTVTWNVANTTAAPVNAASVKISFSSDGGQTFPDILAANTSNDGSESVTIPNVGTIQGRIKVEAANSIFFDISDVNFTVNAAPTSVRAPFDFDGDDKSDLSIFRPSVGEWWYLRSSNGTNSAATLGSASDKIVPADFTGDQKTDIAFWRPSTGEWFILRSEDYSFFAFPFGASGDIPVPADFDGDNKADAAVYRPSNTTWYIQKSTGGTDFTVFGAIGDKPVVGDYDGDGKADIAIWRPSAGQWWILRSSNSTVLAATFGASTDKPVQGYYTADNKTDMAFWRPSTGEWYVIRSEDFSFYSFPFGVSTDIPVPGDYDGDDRFDAAVFRPSNQTWFVQRTTAGTLIQPFGSAGDLPIPNAYVP